MILDFHTHAFPAALAGRAIQKLSKEAGGLPNHCDGTYPGLKSAAQAAGITHYVVLPIAVLPTQMQKVNDGAFSAREEGFTHFASVHPLSENVFDEIKRVKDMGFKGVKLHPEYQSFDVDDPKVYPVYKALSKARLITVFHTGYDLGFFGYPKGAPEKLKRALPYFEGAPVVAAHMGGHADWMNVLDHLVGLEGLYFDTSFSHMHLPPPAATEIIKAHGADRILFGSDSPWADMRAEIAFINGLALSDAEKNSILYGNGATLLAL